ncbi:MAG TPA: WYL domain-containing protein, partial [bacterium]|nr:WYL domain-containing protein [bacterium]
AAADSVKLEMEYFTPSRGKVSARVVRPYGLIYNVDRWLIVGWCEMRGETRVFRADRVKSARATVEIFERPPGFDLETFRRDEMFKHIERTIPVRLRFSGGAAGWACRRWPERARSDADGSASVEFRADRLENIVGMMLSLGPEAQVVSPPELKTLVASAASAALSLYV